VNFINGWPLTLKNQMALRMAAFSP